MRVNRSSYLKWIKNKGVKNRYQLDREVLIPLIEECHAKYSSYGYHAIAAYIREHTHWNRSDNLVHKCCKFMGVKSKANHYKQKYIKPGREHLMFDNIVSNDWSTTKPLEKIVSDMACMKYRGNMYDVGLYVDALTMKSSVTLLHASIILVFPIMKG